MKFHRVYVESKIANDPPTKRLLAKLGDPETHTIDRYEDMFFAVKKPYLAKRHFLNLFIAEKRGELIKKTPAAYGVAGAPHFYFLHAYNCIYECEYCYLQGHFPSPDIVIFMNHQEILDAMQRVYEQYNRKHAEVWFHAGEFSDSLAMNHLTDEWPLFFERIREWPKARLELRTKSANIGRLLQCEATPQAVISFTLSPAVAARNFEKKTSPVRLRLKAMEALARHGYSLGVHFDPVVLHEGWQQGYGQLIDEIIDRCGTDPIRYVSMGTVRFNKAGLKEVKKNYPDSTMFDALFSDRVDGKYRYAYFLRDNIFRNLEDKMVSRGLDTRLIYRCME